MKIIIKNYNLLQGFDPPPTHTHKTSPEPRCGSEKDCKFWWTDWKTDGLTALKNPGTFFSKIHLTICEKIAHSEGGQAASHYLLHLKKVCCSVTWFTAASQWFIAPHKVDCTNTQRFSSSTIKAVLWPE